MSATVLTTLMGYRPDSLQLRSEDRSGTRTWKLAGLAIDELGHELLVRLQFESLEGGHAYTLCITAHQILRSGLPLPQALQHALPAGWEVEHAA